MTRNWSGSLGCACCEEDPCAGKPARIEFTTSGITNGTIGCSDFNKTWHMARDGSIGNPPVTPANENECNLRSAEATTGTNYFWVWLVVNPVAISIANQPGGSVAAQYAYPDGMGGFQAFPASGVITLSRTFAGTHCNNWPLTLDVECFATP